MLPSANSLQQSVAPDSRAGYGSQAGRGARMRCSVRREVAVVILRPVSSCVNTDVMGGFLLRSVVSLRHG